MFGTIIFGTTTFGCSGNYTYMWPYTITTSQGQEYTITTSQDQEYNITFTQNQEYGIVIEE